VESLAAKTGLTPSELKKKVRETWKRAQEAYEKSEKKGRLRIYRLKTYPTKSLFLSENCLIETPYQIASGRTNVPVFEYRKVPRTDAPFWFAQRDVEAMRCEATLEKEFSA
jgi:hypothetical protein